MLWRKRFAGVASPEGMWDDAKDSWITARVRSEMVIDPDIRSVNYTIETANGSVYLIGSARSQGELDRALTIDPKNEAARQLLDKLKG